MKIALAQIDSHLGDIDYNKEQILKSIAQAQSAEADVVLFPEFALSGSPLYDAVYTPDFIDRLYGALEDIALSCKEMSLLIGMPTQGGDDIFSSMIFVDKGNVRSVFSKAMIDNRSEKNHFAGIDSPDFNDEGEDEVESEIPMNIITIAGRKFLVVIGSDLDYLEEIDSSIKVDGIFSFSSPLYAQDAIEEEYDIVAEAAQAFKLPLYRVSAVGGCGVRYVHFGGSVVADAKGRYIAAAPLFKEDVLVVESDKSGIRSFDKVDKSQFSRDNNDKDTFEALKLAVLGYAANQSLKKAIVPLCGDLASALSLSVCVGALGAENVIGALCLDSSQDCSTSKELLTSLGLNNVVELGFDTLQKGVALAFSEGVDSDIAQKSILSGVKALQYSLLEGVAASEGAFIVNSITKSDVALGNFDPSKSGAISLMADLFATQIESLAKTLNSDKKLIPASLFEGLKVKKGLENEIVADYKAVDKILRLMIEKGQSILEITGKKYSVDDVAKISKLMAQGEAKRFILSPIVKMSADTFSIDRVMPLAAKL